jgi:hypothetical protein
MRIDVRAGSWALGVGGRSSPQHASQSSRSVTTATSGLVPARAAQRRVRSLALPVDEQCKDSNGRNDKQQGYPDHAVSSHPTAAPCTSTRHVPALGRRSTSGQQGNSTKSREQVSLHQSSTAKRISDRSRVVETAREKAHVLAVARHIQGRPDFAGIAMESLACATGVKRCESQRNNSL